MWMLNPSSAWKLLLLAVLPGATSAALNTRPAIDPVQSCTQCNIVEEGIWNQNLVNTTVYGYSRDTRRFLPVTVTSVYSEGPYRVISWYDPGSGREGHDDATRYYSYRNMQYMTSRGVSPPPSQVEAQERNGWLASCAMARSDNRFLALMGYRACCQSTASRRYGPAAICA
jgi:hypothetical protein